MVSAKGFHLLYPEIPWGDMQKITNLISFFQGSGPPSMRRHQSLDAFPSDNMPNFSVKRCMVGLQVMWLSLD